MHFLLATPYFPTDADPVAGGFIERQAHALARRGHRVDVLHLQARPLPLLGRAARWRSRRDAPAHMVRNGLAIHRAGYPSTVQRRPFRRFQASAVARAVGRVLRTNPALARADVLYAQWLVPFGWGCLCAARRMGLPCMAIARGGDLNLWAEEPALRRQLLALVAAADAVLGNGEYVRRELDRLAARPIGRHVDIVYNPCDLTPFLGIERDDAARAAARRVLELPAAAPLLLFLGQLDVRKGPDTVVDALARLPRAWQLVIAGDGALAAALRARVTALGLGGRVHFLGVVPHGLAPVLFTACDVLALASRRDGLANVLVEGLAAAMPVVATPVGGAPEVVVPGETGWLVPPEHPEALAAAVAEAHARPGEARARGRAGRARVRALFNPDENLARLETIAHALRARREAEMRA